MAEPTINLGNGNWAGKSDNLLGYYKEGERFYKQDFTFSRSTTGTYADKDGHIQTSATNMPRVDYLNNSNGSLILEPQSTNTVTYSEDFSQWGNARTTDTANQITSPDGLNNGTLLEQQSGQTNAGSIFKSVALSSGTYAQSVFAKKKDKDFIVCYSANAERTYFNLSNGTIGTIASGNTAKIEDYGNGWYRCTITYTITSGGVIAFYLSDSDNSSVVTDSGGVYIYGAQLEAGSYSTTLINTSGSSVTRNQDTCSMTNVADRIGQTEGTIYVDVNILSILGNEAIVGVNSGGYTNHATIQRVGNTIQFVRNSATQSGATIVTSSAINIGSHKIAIAYKSGDTACFLNGTQVSTTQTQTFTNGTLNTLRLGADAIGSIPINGLFNNAIIYSQRLSNTELATLTT